MSLLQSDRQTLDTEQEIRQRFTCFNAAFGQIYAPQYHRWSARLVSLLFSRPGLLRVSFPSLSQLLALLNCYLNCYGSTVYYRPWRNFVTCITYTCPKTQAYFKLQITEIVIVLHSSTLFSPFSLSKFSLFLEVSRASPSLVCNSVIPTQAISKSLNQPLTPSKLPCPNCNCNDYLIN